MRKLTVDEMINALAEVALTCELEDKEDYSLEDMIAELSSYEIYSWGLEEIKGETDNFLVEKVSDRGAEGDGAGMWCTFLVKSKTEEAEGYLEYFGRYSSWDSSNYYEYYSVTPEEVTVIKYKRD